MEFAARLLSSLLFLPLLACRTAGPNGAGDAAGPGSVDEPPASLAERTAGLAARDGFLRTWLDERAGKIFLELPAPGEDGVSVRAIYTESLSTGLGSNPIGLDRGQLGATHLIAFRRLGERVLLEVENAAYRAVDAPAAEREATRQSFATSVLWGAEIEAEGDDGQLLVDLTTLVVRDAHGVARVLADAGQGSFELDRDRSALDPGACLSFPDNVELEALVTFRGRDVGALVADVSPVAQAVTLRQHHSFVRLPDAGYRTRGFDPRMGHLSVAFADYAAPLDGQLETRLATRHRLRKRAAGAAPSPAQEALVYYVDRGAPEPVRSALLEGARWWADAFTAAGFPDTFRVELLPEGAHPLDVRYNVIQWVHRSTRGWSYGMNVVDPRTGEILKGHVSLGSLRVRQDRTLFEGLLGTQGTGSGGPNDPVQLALARLRQLSAHEVGHTLGLAHNFAASTYGRASVMDYPAPWVRVGEGGELDASQAYGVGVGAWDHAAIEWLYGEFAEHDEAAELDRLASSAPLFLTDSDARPASAAQPLANLWDNGPDPVAALVESLAVRRHALAAFGPHNLSRGLAVARLEETLAPVYFHHRYQVEAAAKSVGGVDYRHDVLGDAPPRAAPPVAADVQRRALDALVRCLEPGELDLPDALVELLGPTPPGAPRHREIFAGAARPAFDVRSAAATAADLAVSALLQPGRAARLVEQHRRREELPGLAEVLDVLFAACFGPAPHGEVPGEARRLAELRRAVQEVVVGRALELARRGNASVRARVNARLRRALANNGETGELSAAASAADGTGHRALLRDAVLAALEGNRPVAPSVPGASPAPPGSPIGVSARLGASAPAPGAPAPAWGYDGCAATSRNPLTP